MFHLATNTHNNKVLRLRMKLLFEVLNSENVTNKTKKKNIFNKFSLLLLPLFYQDHANKYLEEKRLIRKVYFLCHAIYSLFVAKSFQRSFLFFPLFDITAKRFTLSESFPFYANIFRVNLFR